MAHCLKCGHKIKYKKVGCRHCGKGIDMNREVATAPVVWTMTEDEVAQAINKMCQLTRMKIPASPTVSSMEKQT